MISALSTTTTNSLSSLSGAEVSFNVVLNCTGEKPSSTEKTLTIKCKTPPTVNDLKNAIQKEFSIPACCQSLQFASISLDDERPLHHYHIRDGDMVHVSFISEGDVADILDIVDHMISSHLFIDSIQTDLDKHITSNELCTQIKQNIVPDQVLSLAQTYFVPCSSDRADANRFLFVHCGGLNVLHNLHTQLLRQPWANTPLKMQYLEHAILRVYWNVTAAFSVRVFVLRNARALENIIQSFLRIEINPTSILNAPKNAYADKVAGAYELNHITCEVVYKALGALCNLAEIPECRMQIASKHGILKQLVATLLTPTYKCIASLVAMAGMLCLAYSPETHVFLATSTIIEGVIGACKIQRPYYMTIDERRLNSQLLKYFANIFFAQLLTTSLHLVPLQMRTKILQFLEEFLEYADYKEIREEEVRNGYKWSTLIPFMKLAYHPFFRQRKCLMDTSYDELDREEMTRLDRCCIQCGIFGLSNVLQCPTSREILVLEGLMDYLVSMPWLYPLHWCERDQAHELVIFVSQKMQLQPPSLVNLTRAHLASMHFGLEKVLRTESIHELLSEVYS